MKSLSDLIWKYPAPLLLLSLFIYFSVKTRFVQAKILKGIKASLYSEETGEHTISSFSSLTTTLAATLGTGNIIGLSLAVALGGPGAVFWCWITGILGMACSYSESYICVKHKAPGTTGGPMDILSRKLGFRHLGILYALGVVLCSLLTSAAIQSRAISDAVYNTTGTPYILCGAITSLLVLLTLLGGSTAVHKVCTKLVPFMAALFLFGIISILLLNLKNVPTAVRLIVCGAFTPSKCLIGSGSYAVSAALRHGIARGIFTNEAGLGTSALPAAETDSPPHTQALVTMSATFWDTVVLCGITGIAIVSCMLSAPFLFRDAAPEGYISVAFMMLGRGGTFCLNVSVIIFAFATLIGWAHFGSLACTWLNRPVLIKCYPYLYSAMCITGTCLNISSLFTLSDLASIVLLACNSVMLICMRKTVIPEK